MTYWAWLAGLSAAFVMFERLRPRDAWQRLWRAGLGTDLVYIVLNGHFLGVALAKLSGPLTAALDRALASGGVTIQLSLASAWPWWAQFAAAFVAIDLAQWSIHNLLHRVPALWELHKVHHSIRTMDFWGSMRFHFGEAVVYKSLLYVPLALLGIDSTVLFVLAVVSTAMGHFNHANLRVRMGWLRYVLNGPEMHIWHHAHRNAEPTNVNFAINLAVWDWLFGTAYLPAGDAVLPALGFEGIESFPTGPLGQELWPLSRWARRALSARRHHRSG